MKRKHTKQIFKKIMAMLLFIVLCTVSISQTAEAVVTPTKKNIKYYFKNMTTEADKEILKEHVYFYLVSADEYVDITDENLEIDTEGQYAGCYCVKFMDIPLDENVQMYNSDGMLIGEYPGDNGATIHFELWSVELYVDGVLIDTIYAYMWPLGLPYLGTEAVLQKEGLQFSGWYTDWGQLVDANYVTKTNTVVKLNAGWTTHIHEWSDEWSSNANVHWHECEGQIGSCNITDAINKDGYGLHEYTGRSEVISESTCEDKGITRTYCSQEGCPAYKDIEVDELGHLEDTEWSNDTTKHWHGCTRDNCDEVFDEGLHNMGEWVTVDEPTFSERGSKKRVCGDCGYTETQELLALGENHQHDFNGTVETVSEATCTQAGLKKIHCTHSDCMEYLEERVAPLGHLCEEEWTHNAENHYKVCTRCSAKEMKQAHAFGEWECVREATAESEGLEKCTCTICGYEKSRNLTYVEEPKIETPSEEEPVQTADTTYVEIYATMAMIAGFAYLLEMFKENIFGMTEKQKDDIVGRLIKWGKNKGRIRRGIALALIFGVLLYYHAIGKKVSKNVWRLAKEECNF